MKEQKEYQLLTPDYQIINHIPILPLRAWNTTNKSGKNKRHVISGPMNHIPIHLPSVEYLPQFK